MSIREIVNTFIVIRKVPRLSKSILSTGQLSGQTSRENSEVACKLILYVYLEIL